MAGVITPFTARLREKRRRSSVTLYIRWISKYKRLFLPQNWV